LYRIAEPALSVLRRAAVPDGGTLAVTPAGIIIACPDQLHVYDEDTLEHLG